MREPIRRLRKEGKTNREIAELLGCSLYTISKYNDTHRHQINDTGRKIIDLRKAGYSVKKIAKIVGCSTATVSRWCSTLSNNDKIKCKNKVNIKSSIVKKNSKISKHSEDNYRKWKKTIRQKRRDFLYNIAGNKCTICGYDRSINALCFHHINETTKKFNLSSTNLERNMDLILKEVKKCVLLCHNCHSEVHEGLHDIKLNPITIECDVPKELFDFEPIKITKDVYNKECHWIKCKKESVRTIIKPTSSTFNINEIKISKINKDTIDMVLHKYHYLGPSNKGHICRLGFFVESEDGPVIIGVCLITNPIRKTFDKTCEISRFCLCYRQDNMASKCLSLALKYLKTLKEYKYVQAFSQDDTHFGTIYKAANFRMIGSSRNTYNYDGIHKKTIYERAKSLGLSEHEYAQEFNLNRISESSKTKFLKEI